MDATAELGVQITGIVTGIAALLWFGRKLWRVISWVAKLFQLLDYQLHANGGGSLLDKIDKNAKDVSHLRGMVTDVAGSVDSLADRFDEHLTVQAEANRAMWPAIEAVAEAQPPDSTE